MNKRFIKHGIIALVFFGLVVCCPFNAMAMQGRAPSGPIGGTDINQALIPPPGLYGGLVVGNMNFSTFSTENGDYDCGGNSQIYAAAFAYVWDFKILGGSVLSSLSFGYQDQENWYVSGLSTPESFSGVIDMYSDVFFWGRFFPSEHFGAQPKGSYIPYGLGVAFGLGITLPTGTVNEDEVNYVGSNIWTFAPSLALTYTMPSLLGKVMGEATQFSVRMFYNEYTDQDAPMARYRNGDILNFDYGISQIKGNWQYGISGSYYTQVTDDKILDGGMGVPNKTMMWSVGPIAQYNFTLNGHPFSAKLKANTMLDLKNNVDSNIIFFSIGTKFF